MVLRFNFAPDTERPFKLEPLIVTAAYDEPPNAMNTASVDITFA